MTTVFSSTHFRFPPTPALSDSPHLHFPPEKSSPPIRHKANTTKPVIKDMSKSIISRLCNVTQ